MFCWASFLFQANATQTHKAKEKRRRKKESTNGIRHLLRLPKLRNMMMTCQVITYQGVLIVSYANYYNPDLSFDVVSCLRYHLLNEFGILWLLALPTCSLFQHCSCLAWQWQLTIKVFLHCVLPGFHHTHTLKAEHCDHYHLYRMPIIKGSQTGYQGPDGDMCPLQQP